MVQLLPLFDFDEVFAVNQALFLLVLGVNYLVLCLDFLELSFQSCLTLLEMLFKFGHLFLVALGLLFLVNLLVYVSLHHKKLGFFLPFSLELSLLKLFLQHFISRQD